MDRPALNWLPSWLHRHAGASRSPAPFPYRLRSPRRRTTWLVDPMCLPYYRSLSGGSLLLQATRTCRSRFAGFRPAYARNPCDWGKMSRRSKRRSCCASRAAEGQTFRTCALGRAWRCAPGRGSRCVDHRSTRESSRSRARGLHDRSGPTWSRSLARYAGRFIHELSTSITWSGLPRRRSARRRGPRRRRPDGRAPDLSLRHTLPFIVILSPRSLNARRMPICCSRRRAARDAAPTRFCA